MEKEERVGKSPKIKGTRTDGIKTGELFGKVYSKERQRGNEGWWLGRGWGVVQKNNPRGNEKQEKSMNWGCLNQG